MRSEIVRFESYELNHRGNVRPSAILRRMQQAAREDLASFGIRYEDMRQRNMAFVVSRFALLFERPVVGEMNLQLRTAPNPIHGATFPRSFLIEDEQGICVKGMSLWALLDFEKRALLRPSALWEEIPTSDDLTGGFSCERLSKPSVSPAIFDTRKVYASMLDQNNHLNNCNYADLSTDLLPEYAGEVQQIQISFQKEARLGDTLSLEGYMNINEKELIVNGVFSDSGKSCFMSKITLF